MFMSRQERLAIFRAAACDPTTSPEDLEKVKVHCPLEVALNPNASQETLHDFLSGGIGLHKRQSRVSGRRLDFALTWAVRENPNFDMITLSDPAWAQAVDTGIQSCLRLWHMASLTMREHRCIIADALGAWEEWLQENKLDPAHWMADFRKTLRQGDWPQRWRAARKDKRWRPPFQKAKGRGARRKNYLLGMLDGVVRMAMDRPCLNTYDGLTVMAATHGGAVGLAMFRTEIYIAMAVEHGREK
jgi:hypothetical protein